MSDYQAILWDMDGTLVDSEPLWARCTYQMSEDLGRRIPPEVQALTVGGTFHNTFQICADYAGVVVSKDEMLAHRRTMYQRVSELFQAELELAPGIRELLDQLSAMNVPMMIVTNTPRELAEPAIQAIGPHYFRSTVCGDEVSRGKPDPEIYATAAARMGAEPSECLVFEDSIAGMTSAAQAGCVVVGLPHDPTVTLPAGVETLASLHGSSTFIGVTTQDLDNWYGAITARRGNAMEQ